LRIIFYKFVNQKLLLKLLKDKVDSIEQKRNSRVLIILFTSKKVSLRDYKIASKYCQSLVYIKNKLEI